MIVYFAAASKRSQFQEQRPRHQPEQHRVEPGFQIALSFRFVPVFSTR